MDSSLKNPSYGHWRPPSAPFPPITPPPTPFSHQFYDRSTQSDRHHLNYHNYTHPLDFPPQSAANHPPPSYYSQPHPQPQPQPSPWISQPSCNFSRDFPQSDWVGYMDRNYQLDYGNRTRDCYNGVFTRDWDSYSRSMGGFHSLGYARQDFGENYRGCGQFKSESDGYFRSSVTGTSFAYGNDRYDATLHRGTFTNSTSNGGTVNQRWFKGRENDRSQSPAHFNEKRFNSFKGKGYSDCGSVKKQTLDQKETSSTAGKAILSKVASQGDIPFSGKSMSSLPEKDMDDLSSKNLQMEEVNDNSFNVEKSTCTITRVVSIDTTVVSQAKSKHFSQIQDCENGVDSLDPAVVSQAESKHLFQSQDCENGVDSLDPIVVSQAESKHLSQSQDCENGVDSLDPAVVSQAESKHLSQSQDCENGVDSLDPAVVSQAESKRSSQSQDCENGVDSLDPTVESKHFSQSQDCENVVDSLDPTVVSQAESKRSSQSQDCENEVNSLVETVSRKKFMETTPLNSTAEVYQSIDSDAGKGSSNVQPVERTSVLMCSIGKNKEGGSNGSVLDRELSPAVFLEDVSFVSNQDLGLSSGGHADVPSMDQSCSLDCRVLKACSSDSNVSLTKGTNVSASEFQFNQEVRETAPTCDSSPALEIDSSIAIGNMGNSGSKTVTDSDCVPLETQPLSAGCKLLPNDHLGCGASDVVGSFWMSSVDKDMVDDPLRISSGLVPDSSASLCHHSPSVAVNEQLPNSASSVEANCSSQYDIIEEERRRAEYMDVDIQEEKLKLTSDTLQCSSSGTDFVTVIGDSMFLCGSSSSLPGLLTGKIHNETQAVAKVEKTNNSEEHNKEEILLDASQEKITNFYETVQSGSSLGHFLGSGQTSPGTDAKSCELPMEKCGDGVLVENRDGEPIEKLTDLPYDLGSEEISLNIANTDVDVGEAPSFGGKIFRNESPSKSDVLLSKLHLHADDKCAVPQVNDYVVALPPPDSKSKKTEKKANKFMHAAQKSYPRSLYEVQKDANPPITVKKHRTWHRKSNNPVKPKVIVRSDSTYVRKGNSLLRKPSPGSLGEAQNLQRHSSPPSDSISSVKWASSGEADDQDIVRNGFKSSKTLCQIAYASDCQPKQNPPKLESLNPSKLLYVKRKANQLVAASDIHGASNSKIPPSDSYFKRSKNQLVRNSKILANQAKRLSDEASNSQKAAKMVSERSSSLALSEFEPLSRKADRVHRSPQKIAPQPVPWKRATYWRRLGNPASSLLNSSFSIASRKLQMMRKRHTVYARSTSGYSLKKSKVLSTGGSHLKWSKSIERGSKKPEFLSNVESSHSGPSKSMKDTKISSIPKRLVISNAESVWISNHNPLFKDPKKRTRVLANEKVRWSLNNVRLRQAKKMKYCQFFTRFGKCNKDDGECPYIHDPSKIAVCTKFLSGLCANPDCKLTHKVVSESMPDCYYFLQGLCNNEPCPYRHVHVHQNAALCEGFLRGYCSDANECQKKHTYTCPVFEATGSCPQGSECKLHHPKNLSKGKKRKRESEPWQNKTSGRYFGSLHKRLPESEPMLVNELTVDGEVFDGLDFIRLDVNEQEASENMDSSTRESVSDDSEAQDWIDELIRPVGLMQKEVSVTPSEKVNFLV